MYKEGTTPQEDRDQNGRWIIITKRQDSEVQNQTEW
jgi:hypothetical protein